MFVSSSYFDTNVWWNPVVLFSFTIASTVYAVVKSKLALSGIITLSFVPSKFKWVAETKALTVTTISVLALSQLFAFVEETQYDVFPTVVVEGVGAVVLPVPPVAVVYHNKPVPFAPTVAVKGLAVSPW